MSPWQWLKVLLLLEVGDEAGAPNFLGVPQNESKQMLQDVSKPAS